MKGKKKLTIYMQSGQQVRILKHWTSVTKIPAESYACISDYISKVKIEIPFIKDYYQDEWYAD